jgi:hypothetical protein
LNFLASILPFFGNNAYLNVKEALLLGHRRIKEIKTS